jgi:hypothetical protein
VNSVNEGKRMIWSPWSILLAEQCIKKKTLCIEWVENIVMCLIANDAELKMEIDSLLSPFRHEQQKQKTKILEQVHKSIQETLKLQLHSQRQKQR